MRAANRRSGFTLVETAVSVTVFVVLMVAVFNITTESMLFLEETDTDYSVQAEGTRAFGRLVDVLRKAGRVEDGDVTYPRVGGGGSTLEFRLLKDVDGNGYAFEDATGDLEWDPRVYVAKLDAEGSFDIYVGETKVLALGRHIESLEFQTVIEDSTLHLKEVRVSFLVRRPARSGYDMTYSVDGSVHMRN